MPQRPGSLLPLLCFAGPAWQESLNKCLMVRIPGFQAFNNEARGSGSVSCLVRSLPPLEPDPTTGIGFVPSWQRAALLPTRGLSVFPPLYMPQTLPVLCFYYHRSGECNEVVLRTGYVYMWWQPDTQTMFGCPVDLGSPRIATTPRPVAHPTLAQLLTKSELPSKPTLHQP